MHVAVISNSLPMRAVLFLLIFCIPLGLWQEELFFGFSAAKIFVPLLLMILVVSKVTALQVSSMTTLMIAFVISTSPSLVHGADDFQSVFRVFIGYAILSFVFDNIGWSRELFQKVFRIFLTSIIIVTFITILALFSGFDVGSFIGKPLIQEVFGHSKVYGTEENPNAFSVFYIVGLPALLYFYHQTSSKIKKLALIITAVFFVYTLALTFSRASMAGAILGCFIYLYYRSSRRARLPVIAAALAIGIILYYFVIPEIAGIVSDAAGARLVDDKFLSVEIRKNTFGGLWTALWINPVVGIGYDNITGYLGQQRYIGLGNAHNIFLGVGISFGFICLVIFASIIMKVLLRLWRVARFERDFDRRSDHSLVLGILSGLLINGMFHESYINIIFWLVILLGAQITRPRFTSGK